MQIKAMGTGRDFFIIIFNGIESVFLHSDPPPPIPGEIALNVPERTVMSL